MIATPQSLIRNKFLACLPDECFQLLLPHLKPVSLSSRDTLYTQGDAVEHVYFPLNCIVSAVSIMNDGATVEVRMIGRENVAGLVTLFGEHVARNWTRVLIPGDALRMPASVLRELFPQHEALQRELMHCYRRILAQASQRAVCSSRHTLMHRLSCWLLMIQDRVRADNLPLTHDSIAGQLGARRAGITQAAGALQSMGAIRYNRGKIHIANRALIENVACECYLTYKAEFEWFENCEQKEAPRLKASNRKQNEGMPRSNARRTVIPVVERKISLVNRA